MSVDTHTDIVLDTIQFALIVLQGLQTICNEIGDQNNLDDDCENPDCPGCTNPGNCEDCEYD